MTITDATEVHLFDPGPVINVKPEPPKRYLEIDISAFIVVEEHEIWPDGDAPENWTDKEASEVILGYGLERFGILDDLDIDYTLKIVNPGERGYEYHGKKS